MARTLFLVLVALVALVATASATQDSYCDESKFDPKMISSATFYSHKGLFLSAYPLFQAWTQHANLTSNDTLLTLAERLQTLTADYQEHDPKVQGFTVTRSSGVIIIDTASNPPINPNIENHNTRYEYAHAIQCRDHGAPVIFEKYFIPRLQGTYHFFAKAIQTGIDGTWFGFRINFYD